MQGLKKTHTFSGVKRLITDHPSSWCVVILFHDNKLQSSLFENNVWNHEEIISLEYQVLLLFIVFAGSTISVISL